MVSPTQKTGIVIVAVIFTLACFYWLADRMSADLVNASFEFAGAATIVRNCFILFDHKELRGASMWSTIFFFTWGLWNLYWYTAIEKPFSFAGGVAIVVANLTYIGMMVYYSDNKHPTTSRGPG